MSSVAVVVITISSVAVVVITMSSVAVVVITLSSVAVEVMTISSVAVVVITMSSVAVLKVWGGDVKPPRPQTSCFRWGDASRPPPPSKLNSSFNRNNLVRDENRFSNLT